VNPAPYGDASSSATLTGHASTAASSTGQADLHDAGDVDACGGLSECCLFVAPECPAVVAARNPAFCQLALESTESGEVRSAGEPICPSDSGTTPCFALCPQPPEPTVFGTITAPTCKTLDTCCSDISAAGGPDTCTFVSLEDSDGACADALRAFQDLGLCR
jgi:hypothetical protein